MRMKDKRYKDLYCTGTNLTKQQLEIFSYESTPDMPIALAVRISGSIPFYFEPVSLTDDKRKIERSDTTRARNYYVDGGMLCNYPISMFDSCESGSNPLLCDKVRFNRQTLGIKLERPQQIGNFENDNIAIPGYTINKLSDFLTAFGNLTIETMNRKYPNLENERGRTIYVSFGDIKAKIRRMKPEEKKTLFENGFNAACNFLAGY
jgi:NTE family protein